MQEQITTRLKPHLLFAAGAAILLLVYQAALVQRMRNEARTLETLTPPISLGTGKPDENEALAVALAASVGPGSLYGDVNALALSSGLSLASYEESQSVEANQAVLLTQDIALQATATYSNLLVFVASLRTAHPNVALVSATVDRKAGESGRGQAGPIAPSELQASIRLRAYWVAELANTTRLP